MLVSQVGRGVEGTTAPRRRQHRAVPLARAAGWYNRPMRWGQLTLVENDPPKLDVPYWLDYFRRTYCDAVTLSAGGVVAFV